MTTSVLAVLPGERRDRMLIKRLLAHLARIRRQRWVSLDFPEERIKSRAAVQVIAMEETGRTTAIEHVLLESPASRSEEARQFLAAFEPLEREASLQLPGFHLDVAVRAVSPPLRVDWKLLASGVRGWCARRAAAAPEGFSSHVITVSSRAVHLQVEKVRCFDQTGQLSITRVEPPADFEAVVQAGLQRQLGRLMSASADRHTLLFAKADGLWSLGQLRTELEASPEFPGLARLHEIWFVNTSGHPTEDEFAFRLVLQKQSD